MLELALILMVVTFVLLGVGLYRSSAKFAVEKRIEKIRAADEQTAEEEMEQPFIQRVLLPLGGLVAKMFRGYMPAEVREKTHQKLVKAGLYPRVTAVQLVGLCWF